MKRTGPRHSDLHTSEHSFVLKPSAIDGIGVFATHSIRRGVELRLFAKGARIRWRLRGAVPPRFSRYCVGFGNWLACPADFRAMSVGWHLNHSDKSNAYHRRYRYFASRRIKAGDEITIDYRTL
jgi:SET domain-containing protein